MCALLSESQGVLRVCLHAHSASLPFLLLRDQDLQERYKQVGEGSSLLPPPSPVVALGGPGWQCIPRTWGAHPKRLSWPAQRAGSLLTGHRETVREGKARARAPFPVPERSCSSPRPELSHPICLHPLGFPPWVPASPMTLLGCV